MKRDALALAMVFIAILLFTHEAWLGGQSPYGGDVAEQFYPWKVFERAQLAQGEIPYWNPYAYAGAPFLANVQSAVFYLFDWMLFVFPMERFFGLSLVLHFLIAGAGAYCFARICGATQFPSMIAGAAYGLNGFAMIHIPFGNHLTYAGAAWAPWMLFAATGFLFTRERRLAWAMAATAITFLHFTCGHPQMLFYSIVFSLVFVFTLQAWRVRRDGAFTWTQPLWMTTLFGFALLLGVLMASFQLFATLDYLALANRAASLDVNAATEFSFAPHRLITLLFPEFYGSQIAFHYDFYVYWSCAYAGVIVPFLALSMFRKGERPVAAVPLAVIALLGLFLACGRGNPIYTLLLQMPGFGYFRAPAKFLPYYLVAVSALAALGLERLAAEAYQKFTLKTQSKAAKEAEFVGLAPSDNTVGWMRIFGLVIVLAVVFFFGVPHLYGLVDTLRTQMLVNIAGPESLRQAISNIRAYSMSIGGVLMLSGLAIYLYAKKVPKAPRAVMSFSLMLLLCLDLFLFGRQYFLATLYSADEIQANASTPAAVKFIKSMPDFQIEDRLQTLANYRTPNHAVMWRVSNTAGYDPMSLKSYNSRMAVMEGWQDGDYHDDIDLKQYDHPVLDELNVRFILTTEPIDDPAVKPLFTGPRLRAYERASDQRSWAAIAQRAASDEDDALSDEVAEIADWAPTRATVQQYEPQQIVFDVDVASPGWLRVSEWNYPHWRARIRTGEERWRPLSVYATANGYRALALDAGHWTVELTYNEPWGRWLLTGLAWVVFIKLAALAYLLATGKFWTFIQRAFGRYY
ncbi:MAG: hypothetical protein P9L94_12005 [Candidatus Hinthialibacter antarcticus]|nr:hypothetical protein [Candidatus Hinthialibacter antarcticus]